MVFKATITNIKTKDKISQICFNSEFGDFIMIGLDLNNVKIGSQVMLGCKSSDILMFKFNPQTNNKFKAKITKIDQGDIISCVNLSSTNIQVQSLISSNLSLNLKQNDEVFVYINETSLYISEIL
nr:hypothetical protein [Campylobacter sp.]